MSDNQIPTLQVNSELCEHYNEVVQNNVRRVETRAELNPGYRIGCTPPGVLSKVFGSVALSRTPSATYTNIATEDTSVITRCYRNPQHETADPNIAGRIMKAQSFTEFARLRAQESTVGVSESLELQAVPFQALEISDQIDEPDDVLFAQGTWPVVAPISNEGFDNISLSDPSNSSRFEEMLEGNVYTAPEVGNIIYRFCSARRIPVNTRKIARMVCCSTGEGKLYTFIKCVGWVALTAVAAYALAHAAGFTAGSNSQTTVLEIEDKTILGNMAVVEPPALGLIPRSTTQSSTFLNALDVVTNDLKARGQKVIMNKLGLGEDDGNSDD